MRSIRTKLLAGCGALTLVTVGVALMMASSTSQLADTARGQLLHDAQAETLLLNIDRDSYQAQMAVEQLASAPNADVVAGLVETYEGNRDQTLSRWVEYNDLARGLGDEESRWPDYLDARDRWTELNDALVERMGSGERSTDPALVADLLVSRELHDGLRDVLDGIVEEIYVPQHEVFDQTIADDLARSQRILPIGLAIGVLASTAVALLLAWNIAGPIRRITARAREIADGQLDGEALELDRGDELGDLASSFKKMHDSLRAMIGGLKETAGQLSQAATELTQVSGVMNESAQQTSAEAASASHAGDEVSANVSGVARAIQAMTETIREISDNAAEASSVAGEAVVAADTSSVTIQKLGHSSEEVGNVISVINSIAEQTNLLALNATIEAARAGEAGKGFAVVANEVKELATQTSKATEEISSRILGIQADTAAAVAANEQIGTTIERINQISSTIAAAVEEQSVTTTEIGRSIEAVTSGAQDIAGSISEVASAADSTRQSTEGTTRAAAELSRMAEQLTSLVGIYR